MKNLIEILQNVYGVKVPSDANELEFICLESKYLRLKTNSEYQNIKLPFGTLENIKILGTLTKNEISFDASEVVDCYSKPLGLYKNYKVDTGYVEHLYNSEQSFRSALPDEIYFENPFEEPIYTTDHSDDCYCALCEKETKRCSDLQHQRKTTQENITHKLLILQK